MCLVVAMLQPFVRERERHLGHVCCAGRLAQAGEQAWEVMIGECSLKLAGVWLLAAMSLTQSSSFATPVTALCAWVQWNGPCTMWQKPCRSRRCDQTRNESWQVNCRIIMHLLCALVHHVLVGYIVCLHARW